MLCDDLEDWDGDRGGRLKREGMHVYLQLNNVVVLQKTTHHCKAIIFQLKINLRSLIYNPIKKNKMLWINLTKEEKCMYIKIYKTDKICWRSTKNKWKNILWSWTGRTSITKMSILCKAIYRFMQSLSKFQWPFPQK